MNIICFFSSRRRHTSCALVTGVQTCALPIYARAEWSMNCQQPARLLRPMQNERKLARPIVAKFSLRPEDVMSETARNLDQIVARQNEELAEAMTFGVDAYTSEAYLRAERANDRTSDV